MGLTVAGVSSLLVSERLRALVLNELFGDPWKSAQSSVGETFLGVLQDLQLRTHLDLQSTQENCLCIPTQGMLRATIWVVSRYSSPNGPNTKIQCI